MASAFYLPMGREKRKKNHWVPQAYLRYFAADESKRKIWTFSKTGGEPELKPIEKVAVRYYLYAPQAADGTRDYAFEGRLAELEQWFGTTLWKNVATGYVDLSNSTVRKMVALLMAITYLRNPSQLDWWKAWHESLRRIIVTSATVPTHFERRGQEYEIDTSSWPSFRDATDEDLKRQWIDEIGGATWLAKIFLKMRWTVIAADKPTFITTDNPVSPVYAGPLFKGFEHRETRVFFPLSPIRLLTLDHMENGDDQYYSIEENGGKQNICLWVNAIDKMYSARPIDDVIQEMFL